jgi:large subunit ribosomal protein L25
MSNISITAEKREENLNSIRNNKKIPAILYGENLKESLKIEVPYNELRKIIQEKLQHQTFTLFLDKKEYKILIKDYQLDPVTDDIIHLDFLSVTDTKKVIVPVPVDFKGESEALKVGAILNITTPKVKVKGQVKDIPEKLFADLSLLKKDGDKIRVSDLELSNNLEVILDKTSMIAKAELSRAAKKSANDSESSEETSK